MKILAVGMNYAQHNKELDGTLYKPEEPVIFSKPDSTLLKDGKPFFVPDFPGRVEYEAELVVRISRLGKNIPTNFAHRYYDAFTVGIDFTARDLQQKLRSNGLPWELCKAFDGSATCGTFVPKEELPDINNITFHLEINGQTVQQASTQEMLYNIDQLINFVSRYNTLKMGDLLFTGTPAGVGPVTVGQHYQGFISQRKVLDFYAR